MKKTFCWIAALICLLMFAGCDKQDNEGVPSVAVAPVEGEGVPAAGPVEPAEHEELTTLAAKEAPVATEYTLTYTAGTGGTLDGQLSQVVTSGGAGSAVRAAPAANHHFVAWGDGSTANPRTDLKVMADLAVTARFAINRYTVTYTAGAHGSIEGPARQTVDHGTAGRAVTAVPAAGYHFVAWSDGSTANPRTDGGVKAELDVTADFAINRYTLSYSAEEHGVIEGTAQQVVNHGDSGHEVSAVASPGYQFVGWSDGVSTASRTDNEVTADLEVAARFEILTYTIGGQVVGLVDGTTLVLQNNGGDDLAVASAGRFRFAAALPVGEAYAVTVLTQPTSPGQTCTVSRGTGVVADEDVEDIQVECRLNTFTVGGTVLGLAEGDQLVLRNNDGDDLLVAANGDFTFSLALEDGSGYRVTIHDRSLGQNWSCLLSSNTGELAGGDVTDVDIFCSPNVELQVAAVPGHNRLELTWNSHAFSAATFNLCRAREEIPLDGFARCAELNRGAAQSKVVSPLVLSRLAVNLTYWLQLEVRHASGHRTYSPVMTATVYGGLNDTGIDWCADNLSNHALEGNRSEKATSCEALATGLPGQDAHYGRDAAARVRQLTKTGSGAAGFDFTKVCVNGSVAGEGRCPPNPALGDGLENWACVHDNVTGLMWEVKTTTGQRSHEHTYSWYDPDPAANGGVSGAQNGGVCAEIGCDTQAYIEAVNARGLCGARDWRLPSRKELLSIVDNGRFKPTIDTGYFPNTKAAYFWTASPYADQPGSAWQVYFVYGEAYASSKSQAGAVRLVRTAE